MTRIFSRRRKRRSATSRPAGATLNLLCLLGMLCITLASSGPLLARESGRALFERAYRIEKDAPEEAIGLYREAIIAGLPAELNRAARWRLFYLYREVRDYPAALASANALGQSSQVTTDLRREMAQHYGAPAASIDDLIAGAAALDRVVRPQTAEAARTAALTEALAHFRAALQRAPDQPRLRQEVLDRLVRANRGAEALALLDEIRGAGYELSRADLLLSLRRNEEARSALMDLARSETLTASADRARTLYLLGRIERDADRRSDAARYFRLAANYSGPEDVRIAALAAFELYRLGLKSQALALLRGRPVERDADATLLSLVLRAELERNRQAVQALRELRPRLERTPPARRSALVRRALELAGAPEGTLAPRNQPAPEPPLEIQSPATTRPAPAPAGEPGDETANEDLSPAPGPASDQPTIPSANDKPAESTEPGVRPRSFWSRDFTERFGAELEIITPAGYSVAVYRNVEPLQFHGYGVTRGALRPRLAEPLGVPGAIRDLTQIVGRQTGNFVILLTPAAMAGEPALNPNEFSLRFQLPLVRGKDGARYFLLNLISDGAGGLLAELEKDNGRNSSGEYAAGVIVRLSIARSTAP